MTFDIRRLQQIIGFVFFMALILICSPLFFSQTTAEPDADTPIATKNTPSTPAFVANNHQDDLALLSLESENNNPYSPNATIANSANNADSIEMILSSREFKSTEEPSENIIPNNLWTTLENDQEATNPNSTDVPSSQQAISLETPKKPQKPLANTPAEVLSNTINVPTLSLIAESGKTPPKNQQTHKNISSTTPKSPQYFLQVGAFKNLVNAEKESDKLKLQKYPVMIESSNQTHRVRVGPYSSKKQAESIQKKLKNQGVNAHIISLS